MANESPRERVEEDDDDVDDEEAGEGSGRSRDDPVGPATPRDADVDLWRPPVEPEDDEMLSSEEPVEDIMPCRNLF